LELPLNAALNQEFPFLIFYLTQRISGEQYSVSINYLFYLTVYIQNRRIIWSSKRKRLESNCVTDEK